MKYMLHRQGILCGKWLCGTLLVFSISLLTTHFALGGDAVAVNSTEKAADAKPAAKEEQSAAGEKKEEKKIRSADALGFQQAKVAAEMAELEQRMFRLGETLRSLEPENSSRLMIGLKFAREELILHQMKQVQDQLVKASLGESLIEQKQLLGKLDRLEQLLLSADLDFQMRLERLRQIREILRRLEPVIREEDREKKLSNKTTAKEDQIAELKKRATTIEELLKRENEHLDNTKKLADQKLSEREETALDDLATEQQKTQEDTTNLAPPKEDAPEVSESLTKAAAEMRAAGEKLTNQEPSEAQPAMKQAIEALNKALEDTKAQQKEMQAQLNAESFAAMAKDQENNRTSTENLNDMVRGLGDSGAAALAELLKAGGSMSRAEGNLRGQESGSAGKQQELALASLKYARELLAEEAQRLQDQLRAEVKKRVLEGLALMLDQQVVIRQSTESLAPRIVKNSRQAQASVIGLSRSETKVIGLADELVTLVEETEFGIALPAAMRVVRDQMEAVQVSLADAQANDEVITAEKQIETDIQSLLEAMKQMPSAGKDRSAEGKAAPSDEEQQRELNRLIAELKMVRLLEIRLHQDTTTADSRRGEAKTLAAKLRREIIDLGGRQEDVRDVTEKLAIERGKDLDR